MSERRVLVVGGGVIGISCAYFLARRGASVVLLERDEVGKGASFGNAGAVATGHGPMAKPGRVRQAIKWMLDPTAPLHVPPRFDPTLARWLWAFRRFCTHDHVEASMRVLGPLGHATRALFDQLVEEEALDCAFRPEGYYEVYRTPAGLAGAEAEAGLSERHGFAVERVPGPALREREPTLREGTVGGVYFPDAATLNPHRFVVEMADRAGRRGADVRTGQEVAQVRSSGGRVRGAVTTRGEHVEADVVVLATGPYSLGLARRLGVRLPIQPAKGYHRDRSPARGGAPALGITCMLGERHVFCTPMDGFVRFAGTLELSGLNHRIRQERLEQLTRAADQYLEGVGEVPSESEWCGLRPCAPDGMPLVGAVPGQDGLFVANGHAMLGLTLAPITGKLLAEWILDGRPSMEIGALRVDRFGR